MVSEPVFWNPNPFRPNLSGHLSFRPSLSLAISHSGHQSLFSESREKTLSGRSNRRQKTFTAGNFSGELSGDGFFLHRKERLEEISNFSQSTGTRNPSMRRPRALFPARDYISRVGAWGRVSHFPATFRKSVFWRLFDWLESVFSLGSENRDWWPEWERERDDRIEIWPERFGRNEWWPE